MSAQNTSASSTTTSSKMSRPSTSVRDLQARAYQRWVEEGESEHKSHKSSKASANQTEDSQARRPSVRDLYARMLA